MWGFFVWIICQKKKKKKNRLEISHSEKWNFIKCEERQHPTTMAVQKRRHVFLPRHQQRWLTKLVVFVSLHQAFDKWDEKLSKKLNDLKGSLWQSKRRSVGLVWYLLLSLFRWGVSICKNASHCPTDILKYVRGTVSTLLWIVTFADVATQTWHSFILSFCYRSGVSRP